MAQRTTCGTGTGGGFVTKLNPTGTGLIYSTYLSGSDGDVNAARGVAVDLGGNAFVTGTTNSSSFPTTPGSFQSVSPKNGGICGPNSAYVTKLNALGTGLVYSTYLGGSGNFPPCSGFGDNGFGIAIDSVGNAYVTGTTNLTNFPTTAGAFQTTYGPGCNRCGSNAFVTKLNSTGSALLYSTYLGGGGLDQGYGIAVDSAGDAFVTGFTTSTNFPTANAIQPASGGGTDAFVTKVNPLGTGLDYSTYLGGSGNDYGSGIALDSLPTPNTYVTGYTNSTNFPTTSGAFQTAFGGGSLDAFVTKISEAVVPPPPTVGKVTGGGTVDVTGGIANFGFIVQAQSSTGPIGGDLQYVNHASGAKVHSVMFTTFTISGNTATFSGTCTNNGAPCTFNVTVQDNDQPPGSDSFVISTDAGPPEGGTLRGGDIEIH
jgi:beta-propeller repeat-containing protein